MRSPLNVDVFADPGLPLRALKHVLDRTDSGRDEGDYVLGYRQTQIPLRDDGTLDLDAIRVWSRENDSDMLVVITEIPRRAGNLPKIAELHFIERIAIISLPAFGMDERHGPAPPVPLRYARCPRRSGGPEDRRGPDSARDGARSAVGNWAVRVH